MSLLWPPPTTGSAAASAHHGGRNTTNSCRIARCPYHLLQHLRLSPLTSDAYWDFSIDELARCDTPTMIEKVLQVSG